MTRQTASRQTAAVLVDRILDGAVDLSLADPLFYGAEPLDPLASVKAAALDGFRAVVVNDHFEPVSPVIAFLRDNAAFRQSITVAAGVVLNHEVGGLNVFAAEHCLMLAGRLVAMPTLSSQNYCRKFRRPLARRSNGPPSLGDRLTLVDERFLLRQEVQDVLDLIASHDALLDAGYAHLSEVWELVKEAKRRGIGRILVRDPDRYAGAMPQEIVALAEAGVCIGFTLADAESEVERFALYAKVPRERLVLHVLPEARRERTTAFVERIMSNGTTEQQVRTILREAAGQLFDGNPQKGPG